MMHSIVKSKIKNDHNIEKMLSEAIVYLHKINQITHVLLSSTT